MLHSFREEAISDIRTEAIQLLRRLRESLLIPPTHRAEIARLLDRYDDAVHSRGEWSRDAR